MSLMDRRDLEFWLYDWLRADALFASSRYSDHGREAMDGLLDLSAKLAEGIFLPTYKPSDRHEPKLHADGSVTVLPELRRAVLAYGEAGLVAASFDVVQGGTQVPHVFATASMAHFMAANIAASGYPMLSAANARVLAAHATPIQFRLFGVPQLAGVALGTMCLSEPQAGSALGDIVTRASFETTDDAGDRYRLFGNKMWISAGDHDITDDIVHLVLAKIPDADGRLVAGSKAISLFVVPKRIPAEISGDVVMNDVSVAGLNHKMGYRGTSNCLLNFGEGTARRPFGKAGAVGWIVGAPGQGLTIMFQMMNEARIGVGLGAAALAYRGYHLALDYARTRQQGRPLNHKAATSPVPLIAHPDVRRMLMAQKAYAEGALALCLYSARLVDEAAAHGSDEAGLLLGLLTPVAKTWSSEWGLAANDLAIQVHGGYGYTRDFDVEQLYRDNRLNPIHEGTTGIQAIDLLGRKILRGGGAGLMVLERRMLATAEATGKPLASFAETLRSALGDIKDAIRILADLNDEPRALANATPFLSAFGHLIVGWLWLDQALAAQSCLAAGPVDADFHNGKLWACRYFFDYEMPRIASWLAPVRGRSDLAVPDGAF